MYRNSKSALGVEAACACWVWKQRVRKKRGLARPEAKVRGCGNVALLLESRAAARAETERERRPHCATVINQQASK